MSQQDKRIFVIDDEAGRLDVFLAAACPDLSRSRLQSLIKNGDVLVGGAPVKANYRVSRGEEVSLCLPPTVKTELLPQDLPLKIVYEDADIAVVDKPQGMVVHPSAGHSQDTMVNALLHSCASLSGINGELRPGIVHRIDKDTSGLLVAALNDEAHKKLADQWKTHDIKRIYYAVLSGEMAEPAGVIDAPIGRHPRQRLKMSVNTTNGRPAVTRYKVIERFNGYTLVECQLETGRTHQIRVHMAYLGYPVLGDPLYGAKKCPFKLSGQVLHAAVLGFNHPKSGQWMEFNSDLPPYFQDLLQELTPFRRES